jgi:hypothetical protein
MWKILTFLPHVFNQHASNCAHLYLLFVTLPILPAANLGSVGCAIGGLLGEDDHSEAATMSPWCARQRIVSSSTRAAGKGGMASSTSAATL